MTVKRPKRPSDPNRLAKLIVDIAKLVEDAETKPGKRGPYTKRG